MKEDLTDIQKHVARKVKPIFDKVLQEKPNNQLLVGAGSGSTPHIFYKPHNVRLHFDFSKKTFNPDTCPNGLVLKPQNYGSEFLLRDFMGCNVLVKKFQVIIQVKKACERHHRIVLDKDCYDRVVSIISGFVVDSRLVLKAFVRLFGGESVFELLKVHSEDKLLHESIVDSLPLREKFHNDVSKKVYNESNVEFKGSHFLANYIRNQALLSEGLQVEDWAEANIMVFPRDLFALEKVVVLMSKSNKLRLSEYLFLKFGGSA